MTARLEEARAGSAIVATLRLAAAGPATAAVAWVLLAVAYVALELGAQALGVATKTEKGALTTGYWLYRAGSDAATAIASIVGLHAILRGRAPDPRRPAVLAVIGLMFLVELYWSVLDALMFGVAPVSFAATAGKIIAWTAGVGLGAALFTRLLLWPVGLLLGRTDLPPRRSWARMRGWTLGYLGAWFGLFGAGLVVGLAILAMVERVTGQSESVAETVADNIVSAALTAMATALSAVAYERRMGTDSESLADVFD